MEQMFASISPARILRTGLFFLITLVAWSFFASQAHAANRYWVGRQVQPDVNYPGARNWESAQNWSTTPKGTAGATVPGASDIAIFNFSGSGNTVLLHSNVSVGGLSMTNAFTGTFLQGTGALNIGSDGFRMGSGTFVGSGALRINGAGLTQTGGIIKQGYGAVGTVHTMSGDFLKSGSKSFYTNTGTLVLDGAADQNLQLDRAVLRNLTLENSGGSTDDDIIVSSGSLALSGALTVTLGNLDLTTNSIAMIVERGITLADAAQATLASNTTIHASGTILINDAATISMSTGTLILNDDSDQSVDLDGQSIYNLTINNAGGGSNDDVSIDGGRLMVANDLTVTLGNLDLDTNNSISAITGSLRIADTAQATMLVDQTLSIGSFFVKKPAGGFTASGGTVILNGTNQTVSGAITFYNLRKVLTTVGGYTLSFYPQNTYTVSNTATLKGVSSTSTLKLRSASGGVKWTLAATTSPTLQYLDVKDSTATVSTDCIDCTDSGNNTNWTFSASLSDSDSSSSSTTTTSGGGGGGRRAGATATTTTTTPTDESEEEEVVATPSNLEVEVNGKMVSFTDVKTNEWFASYVEAVINAGIASGYKDANGNLTGRFGPGNPVTYAEIAKMALETAGKNVDSVQGMSANESAKGQWSEKYIKLAEDLNLSVYGSGLNVNDAATRGAVIQTVLEALGIVMNKDGLDYGDVSASHKNAAAIATATKLGIISGDTDAEGNLTGTFRPDASINRAEVSKIFSMIFELGL